MPASVSGTIDSTTSTRSLTITLAIYPVSSGVRGSGISRGVLSSAPPRMPVAVRGHRGGRLALAMAGSTSSPPSTSAIRARLSPLDQALEHTVFCSGRNGGEATRSDHGEAGSTTTRIMVTYSHEV